MDRIKPKGINMEYIPLPLKISQHQSNIKLYMNFFYVNGHTFLHTKYWKVNILWDTACTSSSKGHIMKVQDTVIQLLKARGFEITAFHGGNEFNIQTLKYLLLLSLLYIYGKDKHVNIF